jgi:hypothetical protein
LFFPATHPPPPGIYNYRTSSPSKLTGAERRERDNREKNKKNKFREDNPMARENQKIEKSSQSYTHTAIL